MLDQSNLSTQRCRLIFWIECSVGGYLVLAKTIRVVFGRLTIIIIIWQQRYQNAREIQRDQE
jgi:hypothetical protein